MVAGLNSASELPEGRNQGMADSASGPHRSPLLAPYGIVGTEKGSRQPEDTSNGRGAAAEDTTGDPPARGVGHTPCPSVTFPHGHPSYHQRPEPGLWDTHGARPSGPGNDTTETAMQERMKNPAVGGEDEHTGAEPNTAEIRTL